ncbi:hypothetical protein HKCCE4037_12355 [Rhodobacterales bacterium HKCCE4037]|nr:hypothetical protein [Rhodobacterales bacterium HKCCE4037]
MKHSSPTRRDPHEMLRQALTEGWETVESMPLKGEGTFLVLTLSGLVRLARNRSDTRRERRGDAYGPARAPVIAEESGNYLAAIAWKWPDR